MPRTHSRLVATAAATILTLSACSGPPAAPSTPEAPPTATKPITITNCDLSITVDAPPQRIISMNPHVTEVLVAMGVGDRIVGRSGNRNPLPELADTINKIPELAKEYPSYEQILDAEPDIVIGGMNSAFNEKEGRSREKLAEAGINSFKFSEYCGKGFGTLDLLVEDYTQLGRILGAEEGAQQLIKEIVDPMNEIQAKVAGTEELPVFVYDSGTETPTTVGGIGAGHIATTMAGGKNLFAEGERPYYKTTWELVAERSPEWIVVLDYGAKSAEDKIADLKAQPLAATTPAVKNERFVVIPLSDLFESQRIVTSTRAIATALHPDKVQ